MMPVVDVAVDVVVMMMMDWRLFTWSSPIVEVEFQSKNYLLTMEQSSASKRRQQSMQSINAAHQSTRLSTLSNQTKTKKKRMNGTPFGVYNQMV